MASISFSSTKSPFGGPRLPSRSPDVRLRPARANNGPNWPDFGTVDENMIVLRKRIHDMEAADRNYETPTEWTGWEKRYYVRYGSDVCELVGLVQTLLMSARPGFGVGMVALIAMSVPTSAGLLLIHLVDAAKAAGVFGTHLG